MKKYRDISRTSGVTFYQIGGDFILVKFRGKNQPYKYSYSSAGKELIEKMKFLAEKGKGLSTFISRFVKDKYERG